MRLEIGFLVNSREKGTISNTKVDDNLKDVMSKADLGLVLGMGFAPVKRFNCGMRLNIGLTDVYIADNKNKSNYSGIDYPNIANRVIHFYIATSF